MEEVVLDDSYLLVTANKFSKTNIGEIKFPLVVRTAVTSASLFLVASAIDISLAPA